VQTEFRRMPWLFGERLETQPEARFDKRKPLLFSLPARPFLRSSFSVKNVDALAFDP